MNDSPALLGGTPVRTEPFPAWPPASERAAELVANVARDGVWSAVDGPAKTRFEAEFAARHGARFGTAVCNGTIALEIAFAALEIGHGDEVIVPAYTFIATATSVLRQGAVPVFVDVDPRYACLDPDAVEAAITERTKAIVPVHLGGHPADLDRLVATAARRDIAIVEDAAHAHGASWRDRPVGSYGAFGCWSFQASKNMTAGEGGIVVTSDPDLAERAWSLHHCGRIRTKPWYDHEILGSNYRLTEFQSALLLDQLERLDTDSAHRERSAALLDEGLAAIEGLTPVGRDPRCTRHGCHLYLFWYDQEAFGGLPRTRFIEAMVAEGVPVHPGYGRPLDRQDVFARRRFDVAATGYDARRHQDYGALSLPNTTRFCDNVVWITQNVLLGGERDIADIVTAAGKCRKGAEELARQ